jgi:hypothetical protein
LELGALQLTRAVVFPAVAETDVGLPGTVAGTTAADALDPGPVPAPLVAVTVNVYLSPLVRPETVQVRCPEVQPQVSPPLPDVVESEAVTV